MDKTFKDKLKLKWDEGKFVCVGLDNGDFKFNKTIINVTSNLVCAYKINNAFFESKGLGGWKALEETCQYIRDKHPDIFLILDAKRADIGNTNEEYVKALFDNLGADGVTVHPYLGKESLLPFLERIDKGIFILVKTSNPGSGEFQDLKVYPERSRRADGKPLYQLIAEHVASSWNKNGNVGVVVGATYPEDLKQVREIVGDMPILVPGVGAQGGDLESIIKNGFDSNKQGLIISSSRTILFSPDPRKAAADLDSKIREILKNV